MNVESQSLGNMIDRKSVACSLAALLAVCFSGGAMATEGAGNLYPLGFTGPQAGYLPSPGSYGKYDYYEYRGSADVGGTTPLPRTNGATLSVNAHISTDISANMFTGLHVFEEKLWGGNPALGVSVPYVSPQLDVDATATLTLRNGRTFQVAGQRSFSTDNIGDTAVSGLIGWHRDRLHYTAGLNLYVPTGKYDKNDVLSTGRNYWALEPNAAMTYLNEQNGRELSAALGLTMNGENSDTQYRSGNELHLELAAIQHFSKNFYAGLAGYAYHQVSGDSGPGATFGDFEGRVYGVGPVIGGAVPLGAKHTLMMNVRYYEESGAKNRLKGSTLFATAVVNF